MPAPPALARLREAFSLSSFEEELLLLCAGVELDSELAEACSRAQGGPVRPSFGLALAVLPDSHWSALAPTAPLRRWRLVEVEPAETLTAASLRIDERVLHYLAGVAHLDERLLGLVEPIASAGNLPPSRHRAAERIVAIWSRAGTMEWPPVQLCGAEPGEPRAIVAAAAGALGLAAFALRASDVPSSAAERDGLARLWEREAVLGPAALVVEREDDDPREATRAAVRFLECVRAPVVLAGLEPTPICGHAVCACGRASSWPWTSGRRSGAPRSGRRRTRSTGRSRRSRSSSRSTGRPSSRPATRCSPAGRRSRQLYAVGRRARAGAPAARRPRAADRAVRGLGRSRAPGRAARHPARDRRARAQPGARVRGLGLRGEERARPRDRRALRRPERHGQDDGGRGARAASSVSTSTASTSAPSSASTSARPRRTSGACSTRPRRAAPSSCSTRRTRCSASAARSRTATTATPTSRSATCCSAWRPTAASRSSRRT